MARDFISFGPVHLEVTNPARSSQFWQEIVGLQLRDSRGELIELGTDDETLIVLHGGARAPFRQGHSGLYHVAIHAPTEPEFARVLARMLRRGYPISPTDHIMSKAIYLMDPDGITVEITLETPDRVREMRLDERGMTVIAADGSLHSGREPLDTRAVLSTLPTGALEGPVPRGTTVGHVHLYVADLDAAHGFYKALGFLPANYMASAGAADLGAGGPFKHRIAVNTWQGVGAPQSPPGTARMRHFTIRFDSQDRLNAALSTIAASEEWEGGHLVIDPSGNRIFLTLKNQAQAAVENAA